jgi:hypothetical protein
MVGALSPIELSCNRGNQSRSGAGCELIPRYAFDIRRRATFNFTPAP